MRIQTMESVNLPQAMPPIAPRDLLSVHDLSAKEILALFDLTTMLKRRPADFRGVLAGKQMVMFFEKPSLRTRLTFEAGMDSLGGSSFFVDQTRSRLEARESLYDIGHNLERWIDVIVLRTFSQEMIENSGRHTTALIAHRQGECLCVKIHFLQFLAMIRLATGTHRPFGSSC